MQKTIYKFFIFIVYFTLFSCSVHYEKEKIINQGQKYSYVIRLNQKISSDYAFYKLNKHIKYNLLIMLYLPQINSDEELIQFNHYLNCFSQTLTKKEFNYQYIVIAKIDSSIKHYYFDLYYSQIE